MNSTDKAMLLKALQSAATADIAVKTITKIDSASPKDAIHAIETFTQRKADYILVVVRLR